MRPRILVAVSLVGCAALAAGVAWILSAEDSRPGPGDRAAAPGPASGAPAAAGDAPAARLDHGGDAAPGGLALVGPEAAPRAPGFAAPPPDALRAVEGVVLDARTGEPVAGVTLSFLSRRPRSVVVRTDARGRFATPRDLSSGVVSVLHQPERADLRFAARWRIEPGEFLLPPAEEGAPALAVELRAGAPVRALEFVVRRPDGAPAAEASVSLTHGRRDLRGVFQPELRTFEVTDERGRASFALFGDEAWVRTYRVDAEAGGDLVGVPRELDPPLPSEPETIDLVPGAMLRVRVHNDDGRPLPGVSLWIAAPESGRFPIGRKCDTEADGTCVFRGLRAACWNVSALHPQTGETIERAIDVAAGEYADVDLRLSLSGLRVAAQGVVLDENGYPLPGVVVRVQTPGAALVELSTDVAGQFQYWARGSAPLLVGVGGGFLDERYEPAVQSVPFGTTGIRVRRVERTAEHGAVVLVADAATGAPCASAVVWLGHAEPSALASPFALQSWSAPAGVATVQFRPRDDTFYAVDAPGYLRGEGLLADLLDEAGPGRPLRIELARGFERRVVVRDRLTRAPLSGARFWTSQAVLGTTDASGSVTLRAAEWPADLRVECAGYEPQSFDPLASGYPGSAVWLEPVRPR